MVHLNALKVGVAIRRIVRRKLLELGIPFTEEKGWINSEFYIADEHMDKIADWVSAHTTKE